MTRKLWLVALLVGLTGCGKDTPMLISQDQEIEIGREVAREVEQEYGQPVERGPEVARVQRLFARLRPHCRRTVPYSATVLRNDEVINAFAAPGGPTWFTTGLVNRMTADDELAFVIGHELAHIEREHGRQAINQAVLVSAAASVLLNDRNQLLNVGASVVWGLYRQGYSRDNEREADEVGLRLMALAGNRPGGAVAALRKLGGDEVRGPAKYLSSHPSTPERIRRLEEQIARDYPGR